MISDDGHRVATITRTRDDPFGHFLAGPNMEDEAILVAEIDPAQIVRGKFDLDVVGHYARPDIFQLRVDERAKEPVTAQEPD